MSYNINPLKAIEIKYRNSEYPTEDLNSVNTDCYGICSAFSGTTNPYDADPECNAKCKALIDQKRRDLYGVGECDHQQPYLPLIWDQTPNYFPKLMKSTMDPELSLAKCREYCESVSPTFKADCLGKCQLQYDSLEKCEGPTDNSVEVSGVTVRDQPIQQTNSKLSVGQIVLVVALIIIGLFVFGIVLQGFFN